MAERGTHLNFSAGVASVSVAFVLVCLKLWVSWVDAGVVCGGLAHGQCAGYDDVALRVGCDHLCGAARG